MATGVPTHWLQRPFCFPLGILTHLLSLGFLGLFTNSAFPWAFTNFIELPRPNFLLLILGIYGLAINPLLSLFTMLWACRGPFLLFYIIYCLCVLFLSFRASLSPFSSSRPICLYYGPMIHYSCCLNLMGLLYVCHSFATHVVGLGFLSSIRIPQKWPSTIINKNI